MQTTPSFFTLSSKDTETWTQTFILHMSLKTVGLMIIFFNNNLEKILAVLTS